MKYLLATIAFIITSYAYAADYSLRFGPGIEDGTATGVTKAFGVRVEDHVIRGVYTGVELGGYVDNAGAGRKGAGLGKFQVGVKPGASVGLYAFAFFGPAGITATDTRLGSHYQLASDAGVGVRDRENFVNVGYSHISNAGLTRINKGRDYFLFSIGVSI